MSPRTSQSIARFSQADWLEAAHYAAVMKGLQASQWLALTLVGMLALLVRPHVPGLAFSAVLTLALTIAMVRFCFLRGYERVLKQGQIDEQLAYLRRYRGFWVLMALGWGMWPLLFHGRLPPQSAVACWISIAGMSGVAVAWMAAHLRVAREFLLTLLGCAGVAVVVRTLMSFDGESSAPDFWLPAMLCAYWLLLLRISRQINELYSSSIDLAYHNARLIQSLREQTRAAEEAARFKDRFLAGAAHDLKQPVSALGIYAEWLSNEPRLVDELGPKILQSTLAINALFDSLFDMVKTDADRLEINVRTVDVAHLLGDLQVQYGALAQQKGLTLQVRSPLLMLRSDPILLRRVLGNLVVNAIRYTAKGSVLLAARRRGGGVLFEVWDTGVGIPRNEQEQVFTEFYKVRTGGTEDGFGLGLAIVSRLCTRLGYDVSLCSRPARGTVFRVLAPPEPVEPPFRN